MNHSYILTGIPFSHTIIIIIIIYIYIYNYIICIIYREDTTWWHEDMDFIFE